ncbi:MAG: DUF222 domain-containing protein [Actinomycetota bacterium]
MAEELLELVRAFRAAVVAFEPERFSGEDCAVLVEELATAEKACVAARIRAAARAGECGAHRDRGFAAPADWLARVSGSSMAAAKSALETAAALEDLPEAKAALETGELSMAQARELVRTEAERPGSVEDLLDVARGQSLKTLKEQARDRRLRAIDPEELHALQQRARRFRHWRTALGMVAFAGELPPEVGVPVMTRVDAEADRIWLCGRKDANRRRRAESEGSVGPDQLWEATVNGSSSTQERRATIAADAFVRLVETGGKGKAHTADLVIVCDLQAYRRGHAHEGEPCHIVGGGPIPVSLARELGQDAFLKAVLHDGVKIDTIAHFGRKTSAALRTALSLGAPPLFDGVKCSAPGCDRRLGLQKDHIDPVANGGLTSFENMGDLCIPHHLIKTEQDRKAGRLGRRRRGKRIAKAPP